jgi:hypothetical protein
LIPRSSPEFHVGDYGTVLEFEVRKGKNSVVNLSTAFAVEVIFMRPDGTAFCRPAQLAPEEDSLLPDGTGGIAFYVLQPGDFDRAGNWFIQAFVEIGGGGWFSSVINVVVFPNLINLSGEVLAP